MKTDAIVVKGRNGLAVLGIVLEHNGIRLVVDAQGRPLSAQRLDPPGTKPVTST